MPGFLGGSSSGASGAGGEINFPKEFIDPVTKLRVSQPENLIDTDFEYGLQPTKWETVELINNTPSFFSKSGDTTIPGIVSINTNAGTREITVTTSLDHGLAVGIPINVQGTKSVTADGSYIINSIPDTTTFTYLSRDIQDETSAIEDLYTSIITGEFFQGSQLRIAESEGIVTDAQSTSTLTVTTENPHGFGPNTPFYFLNLNSTISQEFEAANTASKAFDASNSATAQSFDGSNTLSSLNIDWSNSATVGGTTSSVDSADPTNNTITVTHSTENFAELSVGQPLYYSVSASLGYFADNPRGVVFLKTTNNLGEGTSTFEVSEVPDGDTINIQSNMTGTIQIANQARTFAGNNVNPETQTVIDVFRNNAFTFEGANDQAEGGNGDATITGFNSPFIDLSTSAGAGLDYYVGAMLKYDSTGDAATGLVKGNTYFVANFQDTGSDTYTIALKEFPTDANLISVSGGTGTQTFERIGISTDKNIVHIKNSFFNEKDMLEYEYPTSGAFEADAEQNFYFVATAYDEHNYSLNPVTESFISAVGGDVTETIQDSSGRNYTVHRFTTEGNYTFTITDAGTFDQDIKYVVTNGSFYSDTENGTIPASVGSFSVNVNSGGRVDIAYPEDNGTNDIAFSTIYAAEMQATGGSVSDVNIDGREYRVHAFTSTGSSTFEVTEVGGYDNGELEYLIVAGGGGGGNDNAGGGGAGGLLTGTLVPNVQSYSVIVGDGGNGGLEKGHATRGSGNSDNGQNSSVFGFTAIGGGRGGSADPNLLGADDGGSGGGGIGNTDGSRRVGSGTSGQGNDGGTGNGGGGGGGGGAGQTGRDGNVIGGDGGDGLFIDWADAAGFGENGYFAGGGAGGNENGNSGFSEGGLGGGGNTNLSQSDVQPGQANTGGGGGGGTHTESAGRKGGSGIVLIRYPLEAPTSGGGN